MLLRNLELRLMTLAYIDPGSGSLLVQAIVGIALGVGVFFKSIRLRIASFLSGRQKEKPWHERDEEEEGGDDDTTPGKPPETPPT